MLPFDLDGDGVEELWFVNNADPAHPLSLKGRRLERVDPRTGRTTGQWQWPQDSRRGDQSPSSMFREFLIGGHVRGKPVLVTAQGTYHRMMLQGWESVADGIARRWEVVIDDATPGARGSHMCPVVDIDGDDVDEVMWGERCIGLDDGVEKFCCDRDVYRGHSDMVQPVLDERTGEWRIFTFREGDAGVSPRVATFDSRGQRLWGAVEEGHMDMGWVATLEPGGPKVGTSIRIGFKGSGAAGHTHRGRDEFAFDVASGRALTLPFDTYRTLPVDLNGDGVHELVRGLYDGDGSVLCGMTGRVMGSVGGTVKLACRFADLPGEQLLVVQGRGEQGLVQLWCDREAQDSDAARRRYAHRFYRANRRLGASGFNVHALGGI
jgi:hypothetical protein